MRITGGEARGRQLRVPRNERVRPTAEKVRLAIFNILVARYPIEGTRLLDLFAGSGALGLDGLSRGAAHVLFVEQNPGAFGAIRTNLERSGFGARARVLRVSLPQGLRKIPAVEPYDGVFLDPPYRKGLCDATLRALGDGKLLTVGAWVVAEHAKEDPVQESYGCLHRRILRSYGQTSISLFIRGGE